ncbi:YihY/virulence factor BrkB family protein [Rathayibacter sp. KR2-224]|uniref:YihY/virulence factor BrkB family protein n=1 Tax=Rathayibacter sp. KR2-224 TaxID=3400913 RepID=UPI003BFC6AC8
MARRNAKSVDASPADHEGEAGARSSVAQRASRIKQLEAQAEHEREELTERLEEFADPLRDRLVGPARRVNRWWRWVASLKPYRVWVQFSHNDGNLRTAGMSYQSLFAVFAALWVGFSITGVWLTANPALFRSLIRIVNDAVPMLIGVDGEPGVISESTLRSLGAGYGWSSVIALVGLLWTALAWLYYTRQAVRAMFDLPRDERNYALQKITDLGLAIVFGAVLIVSASVSLITTEAVRSVLDLMGIDNSFLSTFTASVIGFAISIALNFVVLAAMFRVLSRVVIPWRSLVLGTLLGAVTLSGLSALSGLLIGGASRNPLLATFAVFAGLLLWFNLICRAILLAAAWIAVGMSERGIEPRRRTPEQLAYESARAERSARLLVARASLDDAERKAAAAHGLAKWFANREVRDARRELERIASEPEPAAPGKRGWWAAIATPRPPGSTERVSRRR